MHKMSKNRGGDDSTAKVTLSVDTTADLACTNHGGGVYTAVSDLEHNVCHHAKLLGLISIANPPEREKDFVAAPFVGTRSFATIHEMKFGPASHTRGNFGRADDGPASAAAV